MKWILIASFTFFVFFPQATGALAVKSTYPRLVNYFLPWEISESQARELAKWDLLILDMEVQESSRRELEMIRKLNPNVIILAYITSQEILDEPEYYDNSYLRQELMSGIDEKWWLRDRDGRKISNWPYTSMLNLTDEASLNSSGQRFNDYLPEFVISKIKSSGLWDGVFYDNTWGDVSWVKPGAIDVNNDGLADNNTRVDQLWAAGFKKMLAKTRELSGQEFIIIGNGRVYDGYQGLLNGMMLENFPSPWENGGHWAGSMATYLKIPAMNASPSLPVINVYDKNQANYKKMRFGLTSTLMGQGYFSYDFDVTNHGQTWWYDEYGIRLGSATSPAFNLLGGENQNLQPGLWRRDFKNGVAIVNSTTKKQTFVLNREELEKIQGSQDPKVNNGQRINYFSLDPQDGLVLLKTNQEINNYPFINGYFYRVFNRSGHQVKNGFFAYSSAYPGSANIILSVGSRDNERSASINANKGWVILYHDGRAVASFPPYTKAYNKSLNLAAQVEDGYFKKIVTGAAVGGGPQVIVQSPLGKAEASWFAYDKKLRGGVNVALADIDGNGSLEVITGPGPGSEPQVKVFSLSGREIHSFLAYDQKFRGGVKVAAGDLNNDGQAEIVTAPASGGGPHIKVFNDQGHEIAGWFAYEAGIRGGFELSLSDMDGDMVPEILVGIKNFAF